MTSATLGPSAVTVMLAGGIECDPSIEECSNWEIVYDEGSFLNTVLLGLISLTLAFMPIGVGAFLFKPSNEKP